MMDRAQQCLQEADGRAAVLDAAYAAFEVMLSAIHPVQDPASGLFAAFVLTAASAADGRNALALAPSSTTSNPRPEANHCLSRHSGRRVNRTRTVSLGTMPSEPCPYAPGAVARDQVRDVSGTCLGCLDAAESDVAGGVARAVRLAGGGAVAMAVEGRA